MRIKDPRRDAPEMRIGPRRWLEHFVQYKNISSLIGYYMYRDVRTMISNQYGFQAETTFHELVGYKLTIGLPCFMNVTAKILSEIFSFYCPQRKYDSMSAVSHVW